MKDTTVSIGWTTPYRWDFILKTKQEGAYVIRGANKDFDWQWQTFHLAKADPPEPGRFFLQYGIEERGMDLELTHAVKLYTQILTLQYFFIAHNFMQISTRNTNGSHEFKLQFFSNHLERLSKSLPQKKETYKLETIPKEQKNHNLDKHQKNRYQKQLQSKPIKIL